MISGVCFAINLLFVISQFLRGRSEMFCLSLNCYDFSMYGSDNFNLKFVVDVIPVKIGTTG